MRTEPELQLDDDADDAPTSLAGYLLTAERIVMGFVLLGFGLSGLMNFVPEGWLPAQVKALDGGLMQAGIAYPQLKGLEVQLELHLGRKARARRIPERARTTPLPAQRLTLVALDSRKQPAARGAHPRPYRATRRRISEFGASAA